MSVYTRTINKTGMVRLAVEQGAKSYSDVYKAHWDWKGNFKMEHRGFPKSIIEKAITSACESATGNELPIVLYERAQKVFLKLAFG